MGESPERHAMKDVDLKKEEQAREERRKKALCSFVRQEYERRELQRMPLTLQWQLCLRFWQGDQYCDIAPKAGGIYDTQPEYGWQQREVYNHIAPLVEARLARLGRVRPALLVRPASPDETDALAARVCTALLRAAADRCRLPEKIAEATLWSEICGTVFYKLSWNPKTNEASLSVCPPFSLYFDNNEQPIGENRSVIEARLVSVQDIEATYGEAVPPENNPRLFSLSGNIPEESALLLEYYECPGPHHKEGRLLITAGGKLLYEGALPYKNLAEGQRGLPFVQQVCVKRPGCLWGASVVERCLPVQRAYNALKNSRHEYLSRACAGVLTCEEGSCDTEALAREGLSPGKFIVYRAGARPPAFMQPATLPAEFAREEALLLEEFELLSGVSDMMRRSFTGSSSASGVALSLIAEQDDTRISSTAENIRTAALGIGRMLVRLYRQFAKGEQMQRIVGENGSVELLRWRQNDLSSDDVIHETENELSQSMAQRRQMVFDLLSRGLFEGENGRLNAASRNRVLRALGMGDWESAAEPSQLQEEKARRENARMEKGEKAELEPADNHACHLEEHARFMLTEPYERSPHRALFTAHYEAHRQAILRETEKTGTTISPAQ